MNHFIVLLLTVIFFNPLNLMATISRLTFGANTASFIDYGKVKTATPVATGTPSAGNIKVYGGMAGSQTGCTSTSNDTTCNNCSTTIQPCNEKRIYPSLRLHIEFQTDKSDINQSTAKIIITKSNNNTPIRPTESSAIVANTTLYANFLWSEICGLIDSSNCDTDTQPVSLSVGIDNDGNGTIDDTANFDVQITGNTVTDTSTYTYHSNCMDPASSATLTNEGFCYFWLDKGDEKAYIINSKNSDTYKIAPGNSSYKLVRFYYEKGTSLTCDDGYFKTVTPSSKYFDIEVEEKETDTYYLKQDYLSGLTNDERYYFRMANVDIAGNIFYFSSATGDTTSAAITLPVVLNCTDHSVIPEEVVGLLDGQSCFIATAAFGSALSSEVETLRKFRNQYLLTHSFGRKFVRWYYQWSPEAAHWLQSHPTIKTSVRWLLWPIVGVAKYVNWSGPVGIVVFFVLMLILTGIFLRINHRSKLNCD